MPKYVIITNENTNYEVNLATMPMPAQEFSSFQTRKMDVCDDFESAVQTFLTRASEICGEEIECWEVMEDMGIAPDDDRSVDTRLKKILREKLAMTTDLPDLSYRDDIGSDSNYLDVIDNELVYRRLMNSDYLRVVHTNILRMDDPNQTYFFTFLDVGNDFEEGMGGWYYHIQMFPLA